MMVAFNIFAALCILQVVSCATDADISKKLIAGRQAAMQSLLAGNLQQITAAQELLLQQAEQLSTAANTLKAELQDEESRADSEQRKAELENAVQHLDNRLASNNPSAVSTELASQNEATAQDILIASAVANPEARSKAQQTLSQIADALINLKE